VRWSILVGLLFVVALVSPSEAFCPPDAVQVGPACVDKYEASLWTTTHPTIVLKIKLGVVRLDDLQGANTVQLGLVDGDLAANGCPSRAGGCEHVYAVSVRGALPARFVNWFQAGAALRNSGKRLPTNQEWQTAALGTPDYLFDTSVPECNTNTDGVEPTGSRAGCRSDVGAYDMVGNVREMVAEWVPKATGCAPWAPGFSDDSMCIAGADTTAGPAVIIRGGGYSDLQNAGPFSVSSGDLPTSANFLTGFRGAR
jgi:hypothetical protein